MENEVLDQDLIVKKNEGERVYVGFWTRVGASLIDFVVYAPVMGINMYNLYSLKNLPLQIATMLVLLIYKPFMEYRYGATLGKMAVKIKVVGADSEEISLTQSCLRNITTLVSQVLAVITTLILFNNQDFLDANSMFEVANIQNNVISPIPNYVISTFYFVSCLAIVGNDKKQALHDMLAKTFCVSTKK
jgi:uncharacterized RDD family membrane protein YckC